MDNCQCTQYQIKEDSAVMKSDCIQNMFIDLN